MAVTSIPSLHRTYYMKIMLFSWKQLHYITKPKKINKQNCEILHLMIEKWQKYGIMENV